MSAFRSATSLATSTARSILFASAMTNLLVLSSAVFPLAPARAKATTTPGAQPTTSSVGKSSTAVTLRVGVLLPLTGVNADAGKQTLQGIELAKKDLVASSPTTNVELFVQDSMSKAEGAAAAMNKLVKSDKVDAVIGDLLSSNTIAAGSVAQANHVPLVSPGATSDSVTEGKDYVSRICFVDSFQGAVMAKFAIRDLKAKTAFVLTDSDSDTSKALSSTFTSTFSSLGGRVLGSASYSEKDVDYRSPLFQARNAKADVLFLPGYYGQVGVILREARELKMASTILGGDGWDSPDLFRLAGERAAAGHFISNHFTPEDKDAAVEGFVKAYRKAYDRPPTAPAALGYDSLGLLVDAARRAGSTAPEKLRDAINATKGYAGVTGRISLDAKRNATKPAIVLETTKAGYKFKTRVEP